MSQSIISSQRMKHSIIQNKSNKQRLNLMKQQSSMRSSEASNFKPRQSASSSIMDGDAGWGDLFDEDEVKKSMILKSK